MDIKQLAQRSLAEFEKVVTEYRRIKGISLGSIALAFGITKDAVKHVERVGLREQLQNADKQALAVELVVLAAKPGYFAERLLRFALPLAVDLAVAALKDRFEG